MNGKAWMIEAWFRNGTWDIAAFTGCVFAHDNWYSAHAEKRRIAEWLISKYPWWSVKKFRVRKYVRARK